MQYRQLGNSYLKVSEIGLGSDTFGRDIDEQSTAVIISHALDLGVNYIDTADVYGWGGWSERYVGKAVKGKRSRFIIATKFGVEVREDLPQGASQRGARLVGIYYECRRGQSEAPGYRLYRHLPIP